jgi:putative transposase
VSAAEVLGKTTGLAAACSALAIPRVAVYRHRQPAAVQLPRPSPPRALSAPERRIVLDVLNSPRFVDMAPAAVYASLLDEDKVHLCSIRTMYRVLAAERQVRERRNQARRPHYAAPQLLATAPNQVWSWDITKLLGPRKWLYYYLYVMLDIFSRYVVGWLLAERESAELAQALMAESAFKQQILPGQLTIHSDRGSPMVAKSTALLMADLGVTKTHSRPYVSDDNPFSEAHFKTLKYRPAFPERFGSVQHARAVCHPLLRWYNTQHRHAGIALMTPETMHYGGAPVVTAQRHEVLTGAYEQHPERFVRGAPRPMVVPSAVWINPPRLPIPAPEAPPEAPVCPSPTQSTSWGPQDGSRAAKPAERTLDVAEDSRKLAASMAYVQSSDSMLQ